MLSSVSGHPVPRPLSNLAFPLDATRHYLLGQLEYYLSAQNMAFDYFLRKRMDSRGWIPISLLASFNRVRQLTLDPQLVRDVLALSSIVELRDDFVRMGAGGWTRFILPDAPVSTVEVEGAWPGLEGNQEDGSGVEQEWDQGRDHTEEYAEVDDDEEEEEEEEEIEIVMDREVIGQAWMTASSS
ncbi:hypothetical protein B0F90DRAFT_1160241 [Multifurca ochricompacta]|uniref:HTH La-type RNA-binding domain-containing protein n=1 Tax=Multifurca ochricompacta TaxID=376703 RepID=A0AAD4M7Z8_9AGAM|nr:hypothetical protein B0F90DRAFT_1160241 [Multifurca ochricompacta]